MIRIEKVTLLKDLPHLTAIELKSQEFPLSMEVIKEACGDPKHAVYLAMIQKRAVGMAVVLFDDDLVIKRISSHQEFRRVGVCKRILKHLNTVAWAAKLERMTIKIPDYKVCPADDPDYLGEWLYSAGFKATGKVTSGHYTRYCRHYDAYEFAKEVNDTSPRKN